jgi:hypothetical protein
MVGILQVFIERGGGYHFSELFNGRMLPVLTPFYPEIGLLVGVLLCYSEIFGIRIAKVFKNSSKRFSCEATFESEHVLQLY